MKACVFRLGDQFFDLATNVHGSITHLSINMEGHVNYIFQPTGLNKETRQPLATIVVERSRLQRVSQSGSQEVEEVEIEIPFEVLGSQVTHDATGFTGTAILLVYHINGCFHVMIQPHERVPNTGELVKPRDFAYIACSGDQIRKLTAKEVQREKKDRPSPDDGFQNATPAYP
jgi:hypothetical protein